MHKLAQQGGLTTTTHSCREEGLTTTTHSYREALLPDLGQNLLYHSKASSGGSAAPTHHTPALELLGSSSGLQPLLLASHL